MLQIFKSRMATCSWPFWLIYTLQVVLMSGFALAFTRQMIASTTRLRSALLQVGGVTLLASNHSTQHVQHRIVVWLLQP